MNKKHESTDRTKVISLLPDTEENRMQLTKDLTAAIRWYSTSDARYSGDEQSVYRIAQYLESVHGLRDAS